MTPEQEKSLQDLNAMLCEKCDGTGVSAIVTGGDTDGRLWVDRVECDQCSGTGFNAEYVPAEQAAQQGEPSDEAVLPCPFCGGECDPKGWLAQDGRTGPECKNCGATADSLRDWNSRAVLALKPAVPEEWKHYVVGIDYAAPNGSTFDQAFDAIDWDEWRNQPIRELVRMLHSRTNPTPNEWSVFNTGAEVAGGLSFAEAMEYITPERLERGWSVVCVLNKDNFATAPQHGGNDA